MDTRNRGRKLAGTLIASAAALALLPALSHGQGGIGNFIRGKTAPAAPAPAPAPAGSEEKPTFQEVLLPTNTSDPIAVVNGEIITRQQLANECVARKGQEILDTLIARRLIEQAMRAKKMEVTPMEIDAEIERVAMEIGHVSREIWLRTLDKERGISPATYARDIIYPTVALRKLAEPRVQVTEQDLKDAFEANFGPRLRCRIIMTDQVRKATEICEELRRNPGGFERVAKERSLDSASRSLGGLLAEPIARHAFPRTVSDSAFSQLVDGDKADSNAKHKPKDGDVTGPIQVNDNAWVIMRREGVDPGKSGSLSDPAVKSMLQAQMFDVKLKDAINSVYEDMKEASSIDNKLTGMVKEGNEKNHADYKSGMDSNVSLMSNAGTTPATPPTTARNAGPAGANAANTSRTPAGVPQDAAATAAALRERIKAGPPGAPR